MRCGRELQEAFHVRSVEIMTFTGKCYNLHCSVCGHAPIAQQLKRHFVCTKGNGTHISLIKMLRSGMTIAYSYEGRDVVVVKEGKLVVKRGGNFHFNVRVSSHFDFVKGCADQDIILKGLRVSVKCHSMLADFYNSYP